MSARDTLTSKERNERTAFPIQGRDAKESERDRLLRYFNTYFPHLRPPEEVVEEARGGYMAKLFIFGGAIETNKSFSSYSEAVEYVCNVGYDIVCGIVKAIEDAKARQVSSNRSLGTPVEERTRKVSFQKNRNGLQKKMYEREDRIACGNSVCTSLPLHLNSSTAKDREESQSIISGTTNGPFLYSKYVHDYCLDNRIVFPEYTIEKQNGVYVCSAAFIGETFESKYSFDQKGAKEDACRLIYNHLRQGMVQEADGSMGSRTRNKRIKHVQDVSCVRTIEKWPNTDNSLPNLDLENLSETWTNFGPISNPYNKKESPDPYMFSELFK